MNKLSRIAPVLMAGILLFSASALADIVSGASTTNTSNDVSLTQLTLDTPSGVVSGDFLLASVSVNGGTSAGITAPQGWTLITRTNNDTNVGIASYYKVATANEPSTYTWSIAPQTRAVGGITRYSGVDSTNPVDVSGSATGRGTNATAPSVTTTSLGDKVIHLFASNFGTNNSSFFSTTTGTVKEYNAKNVPFGPTTASESLTLPTVGATSPASVTISQGPQRDWVAQTIALRMKPASESIHFVDTSSQYAFIAPENQSGLDVGGNLSLDTWVKFDSFPSNFNYHLISRWDNAPGHGTYRLYAYDPGNGSKLLGIDIVRANLSGDDACEKTISLSPNVWYHLVGTWNNSTHAMNLYQNGSNVGSCTGTQPMVSGRSDEFDIGAFYLNPSHIALMNGLMKDTRVWSKELTSSEVSSLYNSPSSVSTTGLVSWWKFNGNANDSTGTNSLTTVNSPTFQADSPY